MCEPLSCKLEIQVRQRKTFYLNIIPSVSNFYMNYECQPKPLGGEKEFHRRLLEMKSSALVHGLIEFYAA